MIANMIEETSKFECESLKDDIFLQGIFQYFLSNSHEAATVTTEPMVGECNHIWEGTDLQAGYDH